MFLSIYITTMNPMICLVVIWFLKLLIIDTLETDYCKIVPARHFLCIDEDFIYSTRFCNKNQTAYPRNNSDDKDQTLMALNNIRAGVANGKLQIGQPKYTPPQASNMYELKWDNECEKAARNIVKYCHANPDFYRSFSNIFARFEAGLLLDVSFNSVRDNTSSMADLLWHRFKGDDSVFHDINVLSNNIMIRKPTASFFSTKLSILLKAEVSVVGCAMIRQLQRSSIDCIIACVFGGISTWDKPNLLYENGLPCSSCPVDSQCSSAYPGLCECRKDHCFSYSKDVKETGFFNSYAIVIDKETKKDKIVSLNDLEKETYNSTYRYLDSAPTTAIISTLITANTKFKTNMEMTITNLATTEEISTAAELLASTEIQITAELPTAITLLASSELPMPEKMTTAVEVTTPTDLSTPAELTTAVVLLTAAKMPDRAELLTANELLTTTILQNPEESLKATEMQNIMQVGTAKVVIATKPSTITEELVIKPPADYDPDYEQNFEDVTKIREISGKIARVTLPSAFRSPASSPYNAYFQKLKIISSQIVLFLMLLMK